MDQGKLVCGATRIYNGYNAWGRSLDRWRGLYIKVQYIDRCFPNKRTLIYERQQDQVIPAGYRLQAAHIWERTIRGRVTKSGAVVSTLSEGWTPVGAAWAGWLAVDGGHPCAGEGPGAAAGPYTSLGGARIAGWEWCKGCSTCARRSITWRQMTSVKVSTLGSAGERGADVGRCAGGGGGGERPRVCGVVWRPAACSRAHRLAMAGLICERKREKTGWSTKAHIAWQIQKTVDNTKEE